MSSSLSARCLARGDGNAVREAITVRRRRVGVGVGCIVATKRVTTVERRGLTENIVICQKGGSRLDYNPTTEDPVALDTKPRLPEKVSLKYEWG